MFGILLNNKLPIHEQLTNGITKLVLSGAIEPGSPLPSVRELATELAINPNTVQKAFTELEREGISYSVSGKGRFVTDDVNSIILKKTKEIFKNIDDNIHELKRFNISEEEILSTVTKILRGESYD